MIDFIANLHDDMSFEIAKTVEEEDLAPAEAMAARYTPRMDQGRVGLQFYTVGGDTPRFCGQPDLTRGVHRRLDIINQATESAPNDYLIVRTASDLTAVRGGRRGLVLTLEGALPIGEDLGTLRNFHRLGMRSVCLVWFKANQVGDGVGEERAGGLTNFGRALVREMNRLGMLVDIAQATERTAWDVLETSTAPIVASHSNAAGCYSHARNLTDDQIRAIAQGGGLVGLTSYPAHVSGESPTVEAYIRHIDYVVDLVGPDHLCFGLNIIGGRAEMEAKFFQQANIEYRELWLEGLEDITRLPDVLALLDKRGYDAPTIDKIARGNLLRVLGQVLPDSTEHAC